jgi:hypothetical protein
MCWFQHNQHKTKAPSVILDKLARKSLPQRDDEQNGEEEEPLAGEALGRIRQAFSVKPGVKYLWRAF